MRTVLITAPYIIPFMDRFTPILESFGLNVIIPEVDERFEVAGLLEFAGQYEGTICGDDRYTAEVIAANAETLKVISKWGTGVDAIDAEAAEKYGIMVGRTPNAFTVPVSESVLGCMLSFARNIPWMDGAMKAGQWKKISGHTLMESTLGVVGVGNIGKAVIRRARAFGMKIIANDIIEIEPDFIIEQGIEMTSLQDLLERADYISLNVSLNPTSYHLIDAEALAHVKPTAVLINSCRGPVVHEPALIAALQEGRLRGAALDVFEDEPLPADSPLTKMDNVLLSPHNTNSSSFFWERIH
ncbi:MAG: phosphoglycerate dehydrogenase [Anaerolineaceae bacterium]|nr:phosphoglycerate dehydrogenase [Anaerolineaceae bacterium]